MSVAGRAAPIDTDVDLVVDVVGNAIWDVLVWVVRVCRNAVCVNPNGTPSSLVPRTATPNAVRHGAFSPRVLAPRAREVADALMA